MRKYNVMHTFLVNGDYYGVGHCNDTDSRYIIDEAGDVYLTIDRSLYVTRGDVSIGHMSSWDNTWKLKLDNGTIFDTEVTYDNASWVRLLEAEVAVARYVLMFLS